MDQSTPLLLNSVVDQQNQVLGITQYHSKTPFGDSFKLKLNRTKASETLLELEELLDRIPDSKSKMHLRSPVDRSKIALLNEYVPYSTESNCHNNVFTTPDQIAYPLFIPTQVDNTQTIDYLHNPLNNQQKLQSLNHLQNQPTYSSDQCYNNQNVGTRITDERTYSDIIQYNDIINNQQDQINHQIKQLTVLKDQNDQYQQQILELQRDQETQKAQSQQYYQYFAVKINEFASKHNLVIGRLKQLEAHNQKIQNQNQSLTQILAQTMQSAQKVLTQLKQSAENSKQFQSTSSQLIIIHATQTKMYQEFDREFRCNSQYLLQDLEKQRDPDAVEQLQTKINELQNNIKMIDTKINWALEFQTTANVLRGAHANQISQKSPPEKQNDPKLPIKNVQMNGNLKSDILVLQQIVDVAQTNKTLLSEKVNVQNGQDQPSENADQHNNQDSSGQQDLVISELLVIPPKVQTVLDLYQVRDKQPDKYIPNIPVFEDNQINTLSQYQSMFLQNQSLPICVKDGKNQFPQVVARTTIDCVTYFINDNSKPSEIQNHFPSLQTCHILFAEVNRQLKPHSRTIFCYLQTIQLFAQQMLSNDQLIKILFSYCKVHSLNSINSQEIQRLLMLESSLNAKFKLAALNYLKCNWTIELQSNIFHQFKVLYTDDLIEAFAQVNIIMPFELDNQVHQNFQLFLTKSLGFTAETLFELMIAIQFHGYSLFDGLIKFCGQIPLNFKLYPHYLNYFDIEPYCDCTRYYSCMIPLIKQDDGQEKIFTVALSD